VASFFYQDANAPRPNTPRPVAVVALIRNNGRMLFDRRADAPYWGLIAGKVEADETLEQALRREVDEETGLTIASFALFGTFSDPSRIAAYADGNVVQPVTIAYDVTVESIAPLRPSAESTGFAWFPVTGIPADDVIATHRPILDRLSSGAAPPFLD
jgi:8-oxo-dGTP pyrophosphatase MutT (NUDIX family)